MSVEDWQAWREQRDESLREPFGWLSLVSLDWLDETPRELENFPGEWSADGHTVRWEDHILQISPGQSSYVEAAGKQAEVASRFGRICVRVRDPQSPVRTEFTGVDVYPYSEEWIVSGDYKPYAQHRTLKVPTAYPGGTTTLTALGEITPEGVTVEGENPLVVTGSPDEPMVIFRDLSNDLWRAAPVIGPHSGSEIEGYAIDFNRSRFFPAHFTPYGTCPTPPAQNTLTVAVEAGERR